MGNAGIIRELLRYARIQEGWDPGYAIAWPGHPPAVTSVTSRLGLTRPGRANQSGPGLGQPGRAE